MGAVNATRMTAAFTIEMPMATCEKPNHSKNVQNDSHHHFIVALLLPPKPALARDERSIKDPRKRWRRSRLMSIRLKPNSCQ
jgi:hypothetical protein